MKAKKRTNASDAPNIAALFVDLAVTGGDMIALEQAIDAFTSSIDDQLPQITEPSDGASDTAKPTPPSIKQKTTILLARTTKLMQSNSDVQESHSEMIQTIVAACR